MGENKGGNQMEVIRTTGLGKFYGEKKAVDDLNMLVRKGDIYGFIGRNGSGKSTTLKMICGLAKPSTGEIQLFHKPVSDSVVRRRTGMLIENPGIYPEFSARSLTRREKRRPKIFQWE